MAKKKNKDDFNQIPKPISEQKPGDLLSQTRDTGLPYIPGDACGVTTPGIYNLDIIKSKGRVQGEVISYDADQIYNYASQSQRYDNSINLIPAYVTQSPDKTETIYGFCSHNAPKGFWEVVVSNTQTATFIDIFPNVITILCPRPFYLDELVTIESDSPSFIFNQIAGNRTVLFEPDNIKYPLIDIQSSCFTDTCDSSSISPIIIRIETNNFLVFNDLVILNRPIDNFDGLGYVGGDAEIEARKVSVFYRAPDDLQRVYLWQGTDLLITWSNPPQDADFIVMYRLQRLQPPYADTQTFTPSENRLDLISANTRYRIITDFSIFGVESYSTSDPIFFTYPIPNYPILFADDSCRCLGFANISNLYDKVEFGNQVINEIDTNSLPLGFSFISNTYQTVEFGVQLVNEAESDTLNIEFILILNKYEKIDLGGVTIG